LQKTFKGGAVFSVYEILSLHRLENLFMKVLDKNIELSTIFAVCCLDVARDMVLWEVAAYLPKYSDWLKNKHN